MKKSNLIKLFLACGILTQTPYLQTQDEVTQEQVEETPTLPQEDMQFMEEPATSHEDYELNETVQAVQSTTKEQSLSPDTSVNTPQTQTTSIKSPTNKATTENKIFINLDPFYTESQEPKKIENEIEEIDMMLEGINPDELGNEKQTNQAQAVDQSTQQNNIMPPEQEPVDNQDDTTTLSPKEDEEETTTN
jgi:hypothetical protein